MAAVVRNALRLASLAWYSVADLIVNGACEATKELVFCKDRMAAGYMRNERLKGMKRY